MTSKKKLSLAEFMSDKSLGVGNWADDDFDPSSISVPISQAHQGHDYLHYSSNSHNTFSRPPHGYDSPHSRSPPFIVKFSNVPSFFGIEHLEDLLHSRFMKYNKLKLFWEINFDLLESSRNPLDALNKRRKAAFVELQSLQEFDKVLKWNDIYLENGLGKLLVNSGNFEDFRVYNDLNQKVAEVDDPTRSSQRRRSDAGISKSPRALFNNLHHVPYDHIHDHSPLPQLHRLPPAPAHPITLPLKTQQATPSTTTATAQAAAQTPVQPQIQTQTQPQAPVRKSNPFGNAKPVDTLSKELEVEKKLKSLEINKTTFRTLGHDDDVQEDQKEADLKVIKEQAKPDLNEEEKLIPEKKPASKQSRQKKVTSTKKSPAELVPATNPEVSAWAKTSSQPASDTASPDPQPISVSSNVFQSKKRTDKNSKDDSLSRRKVILTRKTTDHHKKAEDVSHIVRRGSTTVKEEPVQELDSTVKEEVKVPESQKNGKSKLQESQAPLQEPKNDDKIQDVDTVFRGTERGRGKGRGRSLRGNGRGRDRPNSDKSSNGTPPNNERSRSTDVSSNSHENSNGNTISTEQPSPADIDAISKESSDRGSTHSSKDPKLVSVKQFKRTRPKVVSPPNPINPTETQPPAEGDKEKVNSTTEPKDFAADGTRSLEHPIRGGRGGYRARGRSRGRPSFKNVTRVYGKAAASAPPHAKVSDA